MKPLKMSGGFDLHSRRERRELFRASFAHRAFGWVGKVILWAAIIAVLVIFAEYTLRLNDRHAAAHQDWVDDNYPTKE